MSPVGSRARISGAPRIGSHLHLETRLLETAHRLVQMVAVARLDHEFEHGGLGRQVGENALVVDLDDVGTCLAQQIGDLGELTRPVDQDRW